jgi:hypothetical protein
MMNIANLLVDPSHLPHGKTDNLNTILTILFVTMGAVALLMLIIGGLRYTIAGGDTTKVADARRMIVYSIVGLVVISLAATIVSVVLGKL